MDRDEALSVARIVMDADGGCMSCAGSLLKALAARFPQFDWAELAVDGEGYYTADDIREYMGAA